MNANQFYKQGLKLSGQRRYPQALEQFEQAIGLNPVFDAAFAAAGDALVQIGETEQAINCYANAIKINPALEYTKKITLLLGDVKFSIFNVEMKNVVLECLKNPEAQHEYLGAVWLSLFETDPAFSKIYKQTVFQDVSVLLDPYFLFGLRNLLIAHADFEDFLTRVRHFLLELEAHEKAHDFYPLIEALAAYCEHTDYIFHVSEEEQALLSRLGTSALVACYERPSLFFETSINALTAIDDSVSQAVRAQYEEFPYPRWRNYSSRIKSERAEGYLRGKKVQILIAGCGTGLEAIEMGAVFPKADILAVDLSLASLSYGSKKAEEFNIRNITFKQADILKLADLGMSFDYIASSGVLHHMDDPFQGWQVLAGLLKPKGLMRIALYSEIARRHIVKAREVIAEKNYKSDAQSIRAFRKEAPDILKKQCFDNIKSFRDYYILPECRDLLFHVHEHRFDIPQIQDHLERLGLEFIEFYLSDTVLGDYAAHYSEDIKKTNLAHWDEYEHAHPDTFKSMYRFWCRKLK